jgi:hydrogenase maturation protease
MRTLVIGYGNRLRCDDGVGQYAALILACFVSLENSEFITCHQLTPELVEPVSRADLVIFIDACEGDTPGQITRRRVSPAKTEGAFTHNVSPETLLAGAFELYGRSPRALLYTVTGQEFGYGEWLSQAVQAALPRLLKEIRAHCKPSRSAADANYAVR